jgi:hypothetical protein
MSIPGSAHPLFLGASGQATGSGRSLRFNSPDSAYLSRTPAVAGNRKTWTWAGWVKRSGLSADQQLFACRAASSPYTLIYFETSGQITFADSAVTGQYTWTAQYRDPSAWYHIVLAVDTTQATASNRLKLYVNGVLDTKSAGTDPTQNADTNINSTNAHAIGSAQPVTADYFSGYLADIHFIDGQALDPSSFGEFDTNGVWQPKAYTGSYGTNGFRLPFSDNSAATATTLGKDSAGSNNWTPNNFSVAAGAGNDSVVDYPVNGSQVDTGVGGEVVGNYATLNPLQSSSFTLSNGNLDGVGTSGDRGSSVGSIGVSSGTWYWEVTMTGGDELMVGICNSSAPITDYIGSTANGWGYFNYNGQKYNNAAAAAYGASFGVSDVIGVALNMDAGTITFYKNGSSQGQAYSGLTGTLFPAIGDAGSFAVPEASTNFGQRPFAYTAPSGFKALCTTNLPEPTIADGSTAMDVVTYTGNGSTQTISGLGFSPDLVWIKSRSNGAYHHRLVDTVRGATKEIYSNLTNAEGTDPVGLTAFNSDGFTLGSSNEYNASGQTFVAWAWDAGTSTVTNTSGSITSQVRANASAGFSIVTYTGTGSNATVGHGLGVAPAMIITKGRTNTAAWLVYHQAIGATNFVQLNTTIASTASITAWNNTAPSSTVFSIGTSVAGNTSGVNNVAYCFAPVAGYSAFGSYTGNGSATDGPFVFCNFRPRWVMVKYTSGAGGHWMIRDAARNTFNAADEALYANLSSATDTGSTYSCDFLSNGFKVRGDYGSQNISAGTYIYIAFAEHPFQSSRAR